MHSVSLMSITVRVVNRIDSDLASMSILSECGSYVSFFLQVPHQDVVELMKQPVQPLSGYGGDNLHLSDLKLSVPRYVNTKDMPSVSCILFLHVSLRSKFFSLWRLRVCTCIY